MCQASSMPTRLTNRGPDRIGIATIISSGKANIYSVFTRR